LKNDCSNYFQIIEICKKSDL